MKKLDYITVLRAIAILAVLIVHVSQHTDGIEHLHPYLISIIVNGARGVQLFYLLSAFTLFHSFNLRVNKEKSPIKNYFIRRFFRIAPLYYLAIIYYLWQDGTGPRYFLGDAKGISVANIISNFTFLHGFSPYWITSLVPGGWSVAIEVIFYCLLPLLFYKIKNLQQAINFVLCTLIFRTILLLVFTHINLITDQELWRNYLYLYLPNQLPIFGLGIVLYFLIYDIDNIRINWKSIFFASIVLIIGFCVQQDVIIPIIFAFGVAFIIFVLALRSYHPSLLFNKAVIYIGQVSYTIYLTHPAAVYFCHKLHMINIIKSNNEGYAILNFILNYGIIFSITLVLSTILYFSIELPIQKIGKKLITTED